MKKVLALVLAVMMMATVAFAADVTNPWGSNPGNDAKNKIPGSKLEVTDSAIVNKPGFDTSKLVKAMNNTNYTITKQKWDEGKNLVESVKFDDANDKLVIKLKQDYTLTTTKELRGEIHLKGKKTGKTEKPSDLVIQVGRTNDEVKAGTLANIVTVGYTLADGKLRADGTTRNPAILLDDDNEAKLDDGTFTINSFDDADNDADTYLWKVVKPDGVTEKQGTLNFTAADGDTDIEVRVYDGDKLYLYNDVDADTDVLKKYADTDADITFLNFKGNPTFNSTATVRFYKEEGTYIYQNKDGVLSRITAANAGAAGQTAGNVKWDDDEGAYVLKTRTLGNYVFSDKPLNVSATTPETTNPDTGANDVVGIASAMAIVALVSAAAVSLKK